MKKRKKPFWRDQEIQNVQETELEKTTVSEIKRTENIEQKNLGEKKILMQEDNKDKNKSCLIEKAVREGDIGRKGISHYVGSS